MTSLGYNALIEPFCYANNTTVVIVLKKSIYKEHMELYRVFVSKIYGLRMWFLKTYCWYCSIQLLFYTLGIWNHCLILQQPVQTNNKENINALHYWLLVLATDGWSIFREIALKWQSLDLIDDMWILGQVMTWCRQATSHYLNQCWPRSMSLYAIAGPQWVK